MLDPNPLLEIGSLLRGKGVAVGELAKFKALSQVFFCHKGMGSSGERGPAGVMSCIPGGRTMAMGYGLSEVIVVAW